MHKQILSENEKEMLKRFLETNEKAKGFRMLKMRILRNRERLHDDLKLIDEISKKF